MSRKSFTKPKVGFGGSSSIKFGVPQTHHLAVSKPVTTIYMPMPTLGRNGELPQTLDESLRSRLKCFPDESQYTDNWNSPLAEGNYKVRYFPIGEELNDDEDITDVDVDVNGNVGQNLKKQMELGMQFDSVKTSTMAISSFPLKDLPPPPVSQSPIDIYEIPRPPSAPPLPLYMLLVDEVVLSSLDPDYLVIEKDPHKGRHRRFIYRICKSDLVVFKPEAWLDDTVINYYIHLIASRPRANPDAFPTVYGFSCAFYPVLETSGYDEVAETTDEENIFNFNLILFPVCMNHHWILVAADNRTRTVTAYNSLSHIQVGNVIKNIVIYLKCEYRRLNKKDDPHEWAEVTNENNANIPQQENPYDCGVFTLQFAEYLSRGQPFDFGQVDMAYCRAKCLYECISGRLITY